MSVQRHRFYAVRNYAKGWHAYADPGGIKHSLAAQGISTKQPKQKADVRSLLFQYQLQQNLQKPLPEAQEEAVPTILPTLAESLSPDRLAAPVEAQGVREPLAASGRVEQDEPVPDVTQDDFETLDGRPNEYVVAPAEPVAMTMAWKRRVPKW